MNYQEKYEKLMEILIDKLDNDITVNKNLNHLREVQALESVKKDMRDAKRFLDNA